MARITGGEARFNERRKIGDYEHRDVAIMLSFTLEDGDDFDQIMDRVTASVKARALAMLQNQIAAPAKPAMSFQTPDVGKAVLPPREVAEEKPALKVVSPEPTPEKRGRGRPPKMPSMTAAPVPTPIEAHIEKAKAAEETWAGLTVTPEAVETSDDWDAIDAVPEEPKPAAPVKTITDKELMAACGEVMAKLGNGIAIKKIIGGFAASLVSIKQEDRANFIAKIKQL